LLLPKAQTDWARWRARLAPLAELQLLDPWQLTIRPETPQLKTLWLNLDQFQGVICVSPFAARQLTGALDRYWPQPPARVYWVCNGPGTAEPLQQAGLCPTFPEHGHTAETVLSMPELAAVAQQKWLVVKGGGGRDLYPEVLTSRGADVQTVAVYDRALDPVAIDRINRERQQVDAILVSSMLLADALWSRDSKGWSRWQGCWILTSERLLDWAEQRRIGHTRVTTGASPEAVAQVLADKHR
jgi:uroporphyrinogen-III synthase